VGERAGQIGLPHPGEKYRGRSHFLIFTTMFSFGILPVPAICGERDRKEKLDCVLQLYGL
jgi:hypothetical protein